ncbi:MAG: phytanoyl-CoA dioxygenase family protein [Saccharospirillaceae bacterium]|nr:phytanoyl-CoA dioxygenase family protein [Saccharospirillaceae bacterium]
MPKHGIRNAQIIIPSINLLAYSNTVVDLCKRVLGQNPQLVRAIYFDKTANNNWAVSWHQDKTICVNQKAEIDNWGPWTVKGNINHVQPDIHVLNKMLTTRIHLDDTNENNGCLKVIPNSHKLGIIKQNDIFSIIKKQSIINCILKAGDALIMRPHTLHSSSKSLQNTLHRRVIHLEFSNYKLPNNLHWL